MHNEITKENRQALNIFWARWSKIEKLKLKQNLIYEYDK